MTIIRDDVQCRCVGSLGPNPECGACGGTSCITAEVSTPPAGLEGDLIQRAREAAAQVFDADASWNRVAPFVAKGIRAGKHDDHITVKSALRALSTRQTERDQEGHLPDGTGLSLRALHVANKARQTEWCQGGDPEPDLAFRGNELAGEVGEACNVIKKLERERHGWRGSRASKDDLAQELADVVICADLCAITAGIDLDAAVVAKFNATSEKQGLNTMLPTTPAALKDKETSRG